MVRFNSLDQWLDWQQQLHPQSIELGLERVYQCALKLDLLASPSTISHDYSGQLPYPATVVTVAGTNGKGSCIAALEQCLLAQNHQVGSYTSPHLHHYSERIRINGEPVSDDLICSAFAAIDAARGDISLTYFEFGTLAALWIFKQQQVPYVLLEVGLGGRLDAVNIIDADIAVVTSIDVDHQEWLGSDRNGISIEKLGVARSQRPLVIAETDLTPALQQASEKEQSYLIQRDFSIENLGHNSCHWQYGRETIAIPSPSLPCNSVAAALCVLQLLDRLPSPPLLQKVVAELALPGRFQPTQVAGVDVIYDVAHNPAAAALLAKRLQASATDDSKTYGVFAVMADKDIDAILAPLLAVMDSWYLGDLTDVPRAASASDVCSLLTQQSAVCELHSTVEAAFRAAHTAASDRDRRHDRIAVFGSFYTVAVIQALVNKEFIVNEAAIAEPIIAEPEPAAIKKG